MVYKYLTPSNVIVTEGMHVMENDVTLRIADVAIAQLLDLTGSFNVKKICGIDRCFLAPELLLKDPYVPVSTKADIWSVGVILYILLSGEPPFNGQTDEEIVEKIKIGEYTFDGPRWDEISAEAKDLIARILCKEEDRISAGDAFQHPWFDLARRLEEENDSAALH